MHGTVIARWFGVVYLITNTINGKRYVGQTTLSNPIKRWKGHLRAVAKGRNKPLYNAIRKHGIDAFIFEVVFNVEDQKTLDIVEICCIKALGTLVPTGYNIRIGGVRGKHHEISKQKLSVSLTIANARPEVKAKHAANWADPKFRLKHAEAVIKALADPDIKARLIAGCIEAQSRPEVKASVKAGLKIANARPEVKARRSAVTKNTVWITDGVKSKRWRAGSIPEGWILGHSPADTKAIRDGVRNSELRKTNISKDSRWVNDGLTNKRIKLISDPPIGWKLGQLVKVDLSNGQELGRHIRWHKKRGILNPSCSFCQPGVQL